MTSSFHAQPQVHLEDLLLAFAHKPKQQSMQTNIVVPLRKCFRETSVETGARKMYRTNNTCSKRNRNAFPTQFWTSWYSTTANSSKFNVCLSCNIPPNPSVGMRWLQKDPLLACSVKMPDHSVTKSHKSIMGKEWSIDHPPRLSVSMEASIPSTKVMQCSRANLWSCYMLKVLFIIGILTIYSPKHWQQVLVVST